jgi:hypothetical protein
LRREYLEFHKSQARVRGAGQIGVDIQEAGRLSQEAAKARVAKLHVLLSRHEEVGPAALAKIAKDTGLRPEDL